MKGITPQRIDHVAIDVTDVEKAKQFYTGLLGLVEIARPESFRFAGAWFKIGADSILHIVSRPPRSPEGTHHFCIWVDDVHSAAKTLAAAGWPVDWDTRYKIPAVDRFFTRDPDGNRIELQGDEARG